MTTPATIKIRSAHLLVLDNDKYCVVGHGMKGAEYHHNAKLDRAQANRLLAKVQASLEIHPEHWTMQGWAIVMRRYGSNAVVAKIEFDNSDAAWNYKSALAAVGHHTPGTYQRLETPNGDAWAIC